jgi:hypothetical protein
MSEKRTFGRVGGGCGCLLLVLITFWLAFVTYVGLEGRGRDEEASLIIGAVTCACTIPIVILTAVAFYFGFRSEAK